MSNNEDKFMRKNFPGLASKKDNEQKPLFDIKNTFIGKDWYLETWFEKILFVLGFVALAWTILKLALGMGF